MVAIEAEVSGLKVICSENVPEEVNLNRKSKIYWIKKWKWMDKRNNKKREKRRSRYKKYF